MIDEEFKIGFTACYIHDYKFDHKTDIPAEVAVEWIKQKIPDADMGNGVFAKNITTDGINETDCRKNGWLNKLFIIVAYEHGKFIALYNHDGVFSVRIQTP